MRCIILTLERASGILLHPTSLSSRFGIGDFGQEAYQFIDFLVKSKQKLWQILPLNTLGYGNSPYQSLSAFAGNPLLISIEKLVEEGLLTNSDLVHLPDFPDDEVQFELVLEFKTVLFKKAFFRFKVQEKSQEYFEFIQHNSYWLDDFCLYMAVKEHFQGLPWNLWEESIAFREPEAIKNYQKQLSEEIEYQCFLQFIFFIQWKELREYANSQGIKIIGDMPLFVSGDSSDTWVNGKYFEIDAGGNPLKVAGVPPDYFSETGQLWGNPHYKWEVMENDDYRWWRERIKNLLDLVDYIRIDHFRGLEAYWEIPAGQETAVNGKWVKGPDEKFFKTIQKYLGDLPIIAEDLGLITPEVVELKEKFNFPGMKVLQFTFEEKIASHKVSENVVYYTGTHDNDTFLGWYNTEILSGLDRQQIQNPEGICWEFIEIVFQSNAKWTIIPLQDVLCLGSEGRMNFPGTIDGNWKWRFKKESLTDKIINRLAYLSEKYQRI